MIFTKIVSKINREKQIKRIINKVDKLNIEYSGISEDGFHYVKLIDGPIFYGPPTKKNYSKRYKLLSYSTRQKLPIECFGISMDIVIRYKEAGLRLGGPKKEEKHKVIENEISVEMGAYRGYYIIYLSKKVGKKGRVIAIEPIPDNLFYLKKNVKENNLKNVVIVEKGIWKESGCKTFFMNKNDMQSGSIHLKDELKDKIKVNVDNLDNILNECCVNNVDFMVIQLNGVEYEALQGLTKIKPKNLAIASRYKRDGQASAPIIAALLEKRGYMVSILENAFVYGEIE